MKQAARIFLLAALVQSALYAVDLKTLLEAGERSDIARSYDYEAQSAQSALSSVKRAYLPKITGSYTRQSVDKQGTIEAKTTTVGSLKASLVIFDGFKRENMMDEKEAAYEAARLSSEHFKNAQALDIAKLYYSCLNIREDMKAKEQKGLQLKAEVERLQRFLEAGSISEDRLERMKASQAMNDYELHMLKLSYDRTLANLETIAGMTVESLEPATFAEPAMSAFEERNDLKAMEQNIRSLDYKARQSHGDYLPTLFVEDSYSTYDYDGLDAGFPIEMVEEQNKITVGLSMTLFDFFAKSKEKEAVMLQKKKLESQYTYQKTKAARDLLLAGESLKTAKSSIEAAKARKVAADRTFAFIRKKYQANVVDNVTFLDALSDKYEAQAMYNQSLNNYEYEKASYYYYAAKELKEFVQ